MSRRNDAHTSYYACGRRFDYWRLVIASTPLTISAQPSLWLRQYKPRQAATRRTKCRHFVRAAQRCGKIACRLRCASSVTTCLDLTFNICCDAKKKMLVVLARPSDRWVMHPVLFAIVEHEDAETIAHCVRQLSKLPAVGQLNLWYALR